MLLNVLLLPFITVKSPINQFQTDSLGKNNERTFVSELAILANKWLNIAEMIFGSLHFIIDGSRSAAASCLLCVLGELAGGGSVAVAVAVSDM